MPRPHIEFVQQQDIEWQTGVVPIAGVRTRYLSQDTESGAVTMINHYPAGTVIHQAYSIDVDKEFFMLRGEMRINDTRYIAGDYAYLPAGYERLATVVAEDAAVLTFYEAENATTPGEMIPRIRTSTAEWGAASDPRVASAFIHRLVLRPDTPAGERTWLLRLETDEPYEIRGVEQHPCAEEMYLLDGDIHMSTGVMRPGAYFWRPPNIEHGPTGSKTGFTALFRAKEGSFDTQWSNTEARVAWDAPYAPILGA